MGATRYSPCGVIGAFSIFDDDTWAVAPAVPPDEVESYVVRCEPYETQFPNYLKWDDNPLPPLLASYLNVNSYKAEIHPFVVEFPAYINGIYHCFYGAYTMRITITGNGVVLTGQECVVDVIANSIDYAPYPIKARPTCGLLLPVN
jgi:hypothetical protein